MSQRAGRRFVDKAHPLARGLEMFSHLPYATKTGGEGLGHLNSVKGNHIRFTLQGGGVEDIVFGPHGMAWKGGGNTKIQYTASSIVNKIGTGDWCVVAHVLLPSSPTPDAYNAFFSVGTYNPGIYLQLPHGTSRFGYYAGGSTYFVSDRMFPLDTWISLCCGRRNGKAYIFEDAVDHLHVPQGTIDTVNSATPAYYALGRNYVGGGRGTTAYMSYRGLYIGRGPTQELARQWMEDPWAVLGDDDAEAKVVYSLPSIGTTYYHSGNVSITISPSIFDVLTRVRTVDIVITNTPTVNQLKSLYRSVNVVITNTVDVTFVRNVVKAVDTTITNAITITRLIKKNIGIVITNTVTQTRLIKLNKSITTTITPLVDVGKRIYKDIGSVVTTNTVTAVSYDLLIGIGSAVKRRWRNLWMAIRLKL